MNSLLMYVVYGALFVAFVLGVEGAWYAVRGFVGEERLVNRRLARAAATEFAKKPSEESSLERWINQRLPQVQATIQRAKAPFNATQVLLAGVAVFLVVTLALSTIGMPLPLAIAAGALLGFGAPAALVTGMAARRRKRFLNQMPQAVDLIARSLQAGHPVASAISVAARQMPDPIGPEFGIVMQEMTYGLDRDAALHNLVERFPLPELRMFVASLEVTRETGGNLAEVFLKLSETIRAKAHLHKKVEAISAEGRMSFWIVTSLPFLVGGALMLLRPRYFLDVAADPLFWPLMSAAPVMLAIGATIIWRMVNVKV